jgi:hypothetical protein
MLSVRRPPRRYEDALKLYEIAPDLHLVLAEGAPHRSVGSATAARFLKDDANLRRCGAAAGASCMEGVTAQRKNSDSSMRR